MSTDIREYHKQALHFLQSMRKEATRSGRLSLLITDNYYSIQRIKIAVIYRKSTRELSGEDRKLIEEIRLMYEEALKIQNDLMLKST